jgi:hypothetical protein
LAKKGLAFMGSQFRVTISQIAESRNAVVVVHLVDTNVRVVNEWAVSGCCGCVISVNKDMNISYNYRHNLDPGQPHPEPW